MMRKIACLAVFGLVSAQAQMACPQELIDAKSCDNSGMSVCGSNGLSYDSACHACRGGINKSYSYGSCSTPKRGCSNSIKEAKCDNNGMSVCGSDGLTYDSSCHACKESNMEWFSYGQCNSAKRACSKALKETEKCGSDGISVCGKDGLTYDNACHACKESNMEWFSYGQCNSGKRACSKALKSMEKCSSDGVSVCGNDGLTYENGCNACSGTENTSFKYGSCSPNKYACSKSIKSKENCGNSGMTSCGSNNMTYENGCQACKADVEWYTYGRCTGSPIVQPPKQVVVPPKQVVEPPKQVEQPPKQVVVPPKQVVEPPKNIIDYFAMKAKFFKRE